MKGKSIIVIAHRLCTIKNADEIIYMKEGQIKEKGTHEELLGLKAGYYTLVNKQLASASEDKENKDCNKSTDVED